MPIMPNSQPAQRIQSHNSPAPTVDLFVVGGGINGTGIAAAASACGLNVALCEQSDLASATSSASSKLIHGGLRYLEHYEFRLVREALAEREVLLQMAPHLIKPLRFVLPHRPHLRPAWMIRTGLFLYDHLSTRNHLPASRSLPLAGRDEANPLHSNIKKGFEYSDCRVDDARLVVSNALAAREQGAEIRVRTRCLSAIRENGVWKIMVEDQRTKQRDVYRARALVNAAGPWAQQFIEQAMASASPRRIRLIKGSHFLVRRLYQGDQAYILQNEDQRIVFVIPYDEDFSLIGTTDKEYKGNPAAVSMDAEEEAYLLTVVNAHFKHQLRSEDILWRYSGVRPLCDDESDSPSAITRDYTLELEHDDHNQTPLLSVFGGKITTYRRLANAALQQLSPYLSPLQPIQQQPTSLPGGEMDASQYPAWVTLTQQRYSWLDKRTCKRLCDAYGTRIHQLLDGCAQLVDMGRHFGNGLYEREINFLISEEWAQTVDDIIWRRSKLGLRLSVEQKAQLQHFIAQKMNCVAIDKGLADTLTESIAV